MTPIGRPARAELLAGRVLALDPGVEHPACACFVNGVLQVAERVKVPKHRELARLDEGERCRRIAELVEAWALARGCQTLVAFVFERPQWYRNDRSKGDPNKLACLAMVGSGVAMALRARVVSPQPREWNYGIPKSDIGNPWDSPRGLLIKSRLKDEVVRCESTHDAVDAAGIGLWLLGRLDRVFPGST